LNGTIDVPACASIVQRQLMAGVLCDAQTVLDAGDCSADTRALIACLNAMGHRITQQERTILIQPHETLCAEQLHLSCAGSPVVLDFLLPCAEHATLTQLPVLAPGALQTRARILRAHGLSLRRDGDALQICGQLKSGVYSFGVTTCVRLVSSMLYTLARRDGVSMITLGTRAQGMRPYLDMTARVLSDFGVRILPGQNGYVVYGNQVYRSPDKCEAEGDWGCAALWYAARSMGHDIHIANIRETSLQSERAILELLPRLGGIVPVRGRLQLLPALCAAAAVHEGVSILRGVPAQEDPRAGAIAKALRAMGVTVECYDEAMCIRGGAFAGDATIDCRYDSRLAMAIALCATRAKAPVVITHAEAVERTDPQFFHRMERLGGKIRLNDEI
jgi:3-phosphoshikimate 1-carboxyvinyltransferase